MRYGSVAAVGLLVASAIVLPSSEASARCWHNGWGWRCGPGLLALPFVAAGAVVAGAAAIATAPVRAIVGPPYYAPPPAYYGPQSGEQPKQIEAGASCFAAEIGLPPEDSGALESNPLEHEIIGVVRRPFR